MPLTLVERDCLARVRETMNRIIDKVPPDLQRDEISVILFDMFTRSAKETEMTEHIIAMASVAMAEVMERRVESFAI